MEKFKKPKSGQIIIVNKEGVEKRLLYKKVITREGTIVEYLKPTYRRHIIYKADHALFQEYMYLWNRTGRRVG